MSYTPGIMPLISLGGSICSGARDEIWFAGHSSFFNVK